MKKLSLWLVAAVLGVLSLSAFSMYVWPTKWRYDKIMSGDTQYLVRIDRFNGRAQILKSTGWRPLGAEASTRPVLTCEEYNMRKHSALLLAGYRIPTNCP